MKVVVVDDHRLFREGLRVVLAAQPDLELAGEAQSAEDAFPLVESHQPDVVVMDISLPGKDGLAAIEEVKRRAPRTRILMLTMFARQEYAARALTLGARGYALKDQPSGELVAAIRAVGNGEKYLAPCFAQGAFESEQSVKKLAVSPVERLTKREHQVFTLAVRGLSNDAMAKELGIGVKTIETHRARINSKLDAHGTGDLVRAAVRYGLAGAFGPATAEIPPAGYAGRTFAITRPRGNQEEEHPQTGDQAEEARDQIAAHVIHGEADRRAEADQDRP